MTSGDVIIARGAIDASRHFWPERAIIEPFA